MNNLIETLKRLNQDKIQEYSTSGNKTQLRKQNIIKEFLDNPRQFFILPIETVYSMLLDLGIREENIPETYRQLIS